jgi:hypothetical protein
LQCAQPCRRLNVFGDEAGGPRQYLPRRALKWSNYVEPFKKRHASASTFNNYVRLNAKHWIVNTAVHIRCAYCANATSAGVLENAGTGRACLQLRPGKAGLPLQTSQPTFTCRTDHCETAIGSSTRLPRNGLDRQQTPAWVGSQIKLRSHSMKTASVAQYFTESCTPICRESPTPAVLAPPLGLEM